VRAANYASTQRSRMCAAGVPDAPASRLKRSLLTDEGDWELVAAAAAAAHKAGTTSTRGRVKPLMEQIDRSREARKLDVPLVDDPDRMICNKRNKFYSNVSNALAAALKEAAASGEPPAKKQRGGDLVWCCAVSSPPFFPALL